MKTRLIGSLALIVILAGLFLIFGAETGSSQNSNIPSVYVPSANDAAMKSLTVN